MLVNKMRINVSFEMK